MSRAIVLSHIGVTSESHHVIKLRLLAAYLSSKAACIVQQHSSKELFHTFTYYPGLVLPHPVLSLPLLQLHHHP
jgi:hypothetical protein